MGGLDDLLPDDADTSSSSRSRSRSGSTSSEQEYVVEFDSDKGTKRFSEERWEEIKQEIRDNFQYTVGEVKSLPAKKRHDVLHEVAISSDDDRDPEDLEYTTDTTCSLCGKDCSYSYVEFDNEQFCINHPVIQVARELGKNVKEDR